MAEQNMNIYQRLAKIRKQVEVIQRNKSGYGYKYVSEDEILAKISGFMDKYHLSLIPSVVHTNTVVAPYHTKKTKVLQNKATGDTKTYEENINKRVDALDEEKKELREKISQMSAEMYDRKNIGTINGYMNNWESVSMDDKLSVVDALIESIHVGHGKVQISWKI